jgi:hypothetical protein
MSTNKKNAICVNGTREFKAFNDYISKCRSDDDTARSTNFFSSSAGLIQVQFQILRAQLDDLIHTGDSISSIMNLTGNTTKQADSKIISLSKKKEVLLQTLKEKRRIADSADKSFLEDIMHHKPKTELAPSLQDATLLLFWSGWITMVLTLSAVRWFSPGGTWQAGGVTLLLLLLVTVALYSLLIHIA